MHDEWIIVNSGGWVKEIVHCINPTFHSLQFCWRWRVGREKEKAFETAVGWKFNLKLRKQVIWRS